MNVPEINGKPAAMITVGASEKINLGNYSNVDIGPISVTRFVEDDPEVILNEMRSTLQDQVEELMGTEREAILELVRAK